MNFTFPKHSTTGILSPDDLHFFYYDIGDENLQGYPNLYEWGKVCDEYKDLINIRVCESKDIPREFVPNTIFFTISDQERQRKDSVAVAFFRHLRNAFAHYDIVRENQCFLITDGSSKGLQMRGYLSADVLKSFCFKLHESREKYSEL